VPTDATPLVENRPIASSVPPAPIAPTVPPPPIAPTVPRAPVTKTRNTKRIAIIAGALIVATAIIWFVVRSRTNSAPAYRFATVETGNIQQTVSATGTLSAVKTVQVGTQVSGLVDSIHADFNDLVTKGELLARIDPTLQKQAVTDAQGQLVKSQAEYVQAKAEYDRNQPLFAQQFISASEFSVFDVAQSDALAGQKSAQVTLDKAKQNLSYTNIFAPISGVVVERDVDVGQTVAASLSAPQLFLIAQDLKQMQILAAVDESDIAAIKDSQVVNFTVESYPGRTFVGSVAQVRLQSKLTDNVVNYTVVVALDNADGALLPGMTATVQFITASVSNVLTVPNLALRYKPTAAQLADADIEPSDTMKHAAAKDTTNPSAPPVGAAAKPRPKRILTGGAGSAGTLYTLDPAGKLKAIHVRVGISDGQRTQVTGDSLVVGMQVIVGAALPGAAATSASTTNPLTPTSQRGGRGGP
jgi:HlyD family secretion protein